MDDVEALQKEVEEIWADFRSNAERAEATNVVISANTPPRGWPISTNRSYGFVFKKASDGTWEQYGKSSG